MKRLSLVLFLFSVMTVVGQDVMTPETLWKLGRVSGGEVSPDGSKILYGVSYYSVEKDKGNRDLYVMDLSSKEVKKVTSLKGSEFNEFWSKDGSKVYFLSFESGSGQLWTVKPDGTDIKQISQVKGGMNGCKLSPTGDKLLFIQNVKLDETINEKYPDLPKAQAFVTDELMYRHWDSWHDFEYSHVFFIPVKGEKIEGEGKDLMPNERFDTPLNPFGGMEQITWSPDGKQIIYTSKKKNGLAYATSTNSELYAYNFETQKTTNLTDGMMGYDMNPSFSADGKYLAWLSMAKDGFEADKNDIVIMNVSNGKKENLTADKDITASDYVWSPDGKTIYFKSAIEATYQLWSVEVKSKKIEQLTIGDHNWTGIHFANDALYGTKQSMQAPNELYKFDLNTKKEEKLTSVNDKIYASIKTGKIEKRWIKTTDGKDMLTWVIYPPDFDAKKKYPTLLYCQGGPQSAVSQFFSFRWNFQLMAANGYIIVAPNRRGLPSFGQEWNDEISKDWGGQAIKDYLSAIDEVAKEDYVDNERLGAIGASYGGYSVYFLAGNHDGRFKTFISHCGLFNLESWYGSTEELFFANYDIGGPYYGDDKPVSYEAHSPHKFVKNWDTPIMVIHGQKDFRVPVTQGMEAFQAAQIKKIPSRFLYFPTESHWVLSPQNGLVWHREFFEWLDLWLKK